MKTYRSHKIVQAAAIKQIISYSPPPWHGGPASMRVLLDDNEVMQIDGRQVAVYRPREGDYVVKYPDGYVSVSPKHAFEDGYSEVTPDEMLATQQPTIIPATITNGGDPT